MSREVNGKGRAATGSRWTALDVAESAMDVT